MARGIDQWYARGILGAVRNLIEFSVDGGVLSPAGEGELKTAAGLLGELLKMNDASKEAKPHGKFAAQLTSGRVGGSDGFPP